MHFFSSAPPMQLGAEISQFQGCPGRKSPKPGAHKGACLGSGRRSASMFPQQEGTGTGKPTSRYARLGSHTAGVEPNGV